MRLFFGLIFFLSSCFLFGQSSLSQILSAPISDQDYLIVLEQRDFIENHKFNSPWLREMEFRLRSDDKQLDIEEYRMRLGLINPLEIIANKNYKKLIESYNEAEKADILNDVLKLRYELIIEYFYLQKKTSLVKDLISQLEKQQQLIIDLNPDFDKIVDLEQDILKSKVSLIQLTNQFNIVSESISEFSGIVPAATDFKKLISPDYIITDLDPNIVESTVLVKKQLDLAVKEQLNKIDKAEAFSNIGYIQGDYDPGKGDVFSDHLGFQVGVAVPIFNSDKPKLQRDELGMIDNRIETEMAEVELKKKVDNISKKIKTSYEQYLIINSSQDKLEGWKKLNDRLAADQSVLSEFAIFEDYINTKKLEIQADMLNNYISYMHINGQLLGIDPVNRLLVTPEKLELE